MSTKWPFAHTRSLRLDGGREAISNNWASGIGHQCGGVGGGSEDALSANTQSSSTNGNAACPLSIPHKLYLVRACLVLPGRWLCHEHGSSQASCSPGHWL